MNNNWRNLCSFIQKLVDILFNLRAKHLQAIVHFFLSFRDFDEMGIIFLEGEENITTLLEPLDTSKVFSFPLHFWIVFFSSGEHGQVKWLPLRQHHLHGDHHRDQLLGGQDHPGKGENANPRSDRLRLLRQHLVQPAHSLLSVSLVCSPVMLSTFFKHTVKLLRLIKPDEKQSCSELLLLSQINSNKMKNFRYPV